VTRTSKSHRHCIFKCSDISNLFTITLAVWNHILINHGVFIPSDARFYAKHLGENTWNTLVEGGHHDFGASEVEEMVDSLRECAQKAQDQYFNFEFVEDISNSSGSKFWDCHFLADSTLPDELWNFVEKGPHQLIEDKSPPPRGASWVTLRDSRLRN
jgi:hypothetical protein